jgi:hypothetical protein
VKQIYEIRVDPGIPENPVYLEPMTHEREFTEEEYREIVNSAAIEAVKRLLDRGEEPVGVYSYDSTEPCPAREIQKVLCEKYGFQTIKRVEWGIVEITGRFRLRDSIVGLPEELEEEFMRRRERRRRRTLEEICRRLKI